MFDKLILQKFYVMKTINKYAKYLLLFVMAFQMTSCEIEDDTTNDEVENDLSQSYYGDWKRDGMETYLRLGESSAIACTNGNITNGTFNPSEPSMTFVIQGDVLKFPLMFTNGQLLVGVPDQGVNTHNAQYYSKADENTCLDGGGNGGGGNATTGNATFWVQTDLGCGNITVVLNGTSGVISNYYSSNPSCNASGSANFELPAGTYSYSASCTNLTWNGTITITNGGCSTMQLTL